MQQKIFPAIVTVYNSYFIYSVDLR